MLFAVRGQRGQNPARDRSWRFTVCPEREDLCDRGRLRWQVSGLCAGLLLPLNGVGHLYLVLLVVLQQRCRVTAGTDR